MASPRRKSAALDAPQTIDQATALAGRYAELLTGCEELRAATDSGIARIEATRDAQIAPSEQEAKDIFRQLSRWWSVAAPAMTDGKRKSVELAGCVIGERTAMPSLKLPKGQKEDEAVGSLRKWIEAGFDWPNACLRIKYNLEKPEIIKILRLDSVSMAGEKLAALGFTVSQREEFFIDRAKHSPAPADPEILTTEPHAT